MGSRVRIPPSPPLKVLPKNFSAISSAGSLMSKQCIVTFIVLISAISCFPLFSMVFDNRFIPLLERPRLRPEGLSSSFAIDYFVATASKALNDDEKEIGIPELESRFDLNEFAEAVEKTGKPNPLRSDFQGGEIPYIVDGRIQAQAFSFFYHQKLSRYFSTGASWLFMRVNTRQQFKLNVVKTNLFLGPGDEQELEETRRQTFNEVGLIQNHTAQLGFGDIDLYLRFGRMWDYQVKSRRVDAGLRLGVLIPSGLSRELSSPASIPFGGDGHWGFYVSADVLLELREDIKAGMFFRVSKRFPKTRMQRISVNGEPSIFGALVDELCVDPGPTVLFSPFFALEDLRKGFGISIHYTLTSHQEDSIKDRRKDKTIPIVLSQMRKASEWGSDYFTINVFYDFGKAKMQRSFDPVLSLRWDVPSMLFITNRVPKTHKISLGVEFAF